MPGPSTEELFVLEMKGDYVRLRLGLRGAQAGAAHSNAIPAPFEADFLFELRSPHVAVMNREHVMLRQRRVGARDQERICEIRGEAVTENRSPSLFQ